MATPIHDPTTVNDETSATVEPDRLRLCDKDGGYIEVETPRRLSNVIRRNSTGKLYELRSVDQHGGRWLRVYREIDVDEIVVMVSKAKSAQKILTAVVPVIESRKEKVVCEMCTMPIVHAEYFYGKLHAWCEKHTPRDGHKDFCGERCRKILASLNLEIPNTSEVKDAAR